ncbi:MAG: dihydroorotate dehydrogenase electron transfer subunit, partial [Clostridia bacterium]|nr:dihydroorotate dehydrogenase electron transfer subunit [Clostridia bacterium]
MKRITAELTENVPIARNIYKAVFKCDTSGITGAGQFVNVLIDGLFLRRPISVCDYDGNSLTLIYKIVGKGTEILSRAKKGDKFDMLTGLGNGYDLKKAGDKPLLIGGGVGVPPLYNLAKQLVKQGKSVSVALGFNTEEETFFVNEFENLG